MAEVQRARVPGAERSVWLVVGDDFLPIEPVRRFLDYLDDLERSPNTVRAYAYHLKLFWDYLQAHNLDWREVGLGELAGFVAWLRRGSSRVVSLEEQQARRSESTINAILSAVYAFREFHRRTGELLAGSTDSDEGWTFPTTRPYKPVLHHQQGQASAYASGEAKAAAATATNTPAGAGLRARPSLPPPA